jgi:hypothetical protein
MLVGTCISPPSLLLRFTNDTFDQDTAATIGRSSLPTLYHEASLSCTGVDFKVKTLVLGGKRVKLSIWVSYVCDFMS